MENEHLATTTLSIRKSTSDLEQRKRKKAKYFTGLKKVELVEKINKIKYENQQSPSFKL